MNNQEQQINQTTTPEQKSKPKPKWFIPIIVIVGVIVLGLIVWGGYELFKPAPPEEPIIEDEFKDWKTYQNEEYGWEVRYPEDWEIDDRNPDSIEIQSWETGKYIARGGLPPDEAKFFIRIIRGLSLQEYAESKISDYSTLISRNVITFNGYESIKQVYTSTIEGGSYILAQYILKNDIVYDLSMVTFSKDEDFIQIFNQILSTFKFFP